MEATRPGSGGGGKEAEKFLYFFFFFEGAHFAFVVVYVHGV